MSSKYIGIMTILLALGASGFGSAFAGGAASVPEGGTPAEAASPPPKSPIRLSTINFQDTAASVWRPVPAVPGAKSFCFWMMSPLPQSCPMTAANGVSKAG